MKTRITCLFVLLLIPAAVLAQNDRPKVAIKTFQNPSNFSRSTIGNGLTDILTTELQNTGKFNVLERNNVDELTKEMDFGNTDYAKSTTFAQKGNLLGAQYILMGKVTNFSYTEQMERKQKINLLGPNTIETTYKQQADVRVDFRLIDVSTGETVISQPGEAHKTNTSQVSEMAVWYRCVSSGSITAEASSSLIGKATVEAVKDIVRKLNALSQTVRERGSVANLNATFAGLESSKGKVLADEGGGLWIIGGIGSANGVRKGDRLKVTHENLVKDKTGQVVYRKPVDAGAMEIIDVGDADHVEARFISNSTNATPTLQVNDTVAIDMDVARSLRGGSTNPSTSSSAPVSSVAPNAGISSTGAQFEQILKRADSYISDKFWSQALDEYNQAAATRPNDPRVLQGQATSHYMMGDFIEADESAGKLLQAGSPFIVAVAHYHGMGLCTGELIIQPGKLTYKASNPDGFELLPTSVAGISVHRLSSAFLVNEKAPDWPTLEIRWRDAAGKEKKYAMIPYMYSKQQTLTGRNLASAFPMDDSDLLEMQKFEQSIITLIQKYVK